MGFSVGGDLFSVLVAVGLIVVFISALAHTYHVYAERRNAAEDFDLALDIAERLRNQVLVKENGQLGVLELSHERVENYSKILAMQRVNLRVEVMGPGGEILFTHGPEPNFLGQYFSPPVGVSVPAAVAQGPGSTKLCELSVKVWRN